MELIVLGSSSQGNCYILKGKSQSLIIEAGLKFKEVKIALDFDVSKIVGLLVTHEHGDHAKYAKEYHKAFIPIVSGQKTLNVMGVTGIAAHHTKSIKIGEFNITPINSLHDAVEPYNYVINHPEMGRLLFITDTGSFKYKIKDVDHFLIEANFDEEIVSKKLAYNSDIYNNLDRLRASHMSIEETKKALKINANNQTKNIILIHLSNGNSNAFDFKRQIEGQTGVPTYIADKGLKLELNK